MEGSYTYGKIDIVNRQISVPSSGSDQDWLKQKSGNTNSGITPLWPNFPRGDYSGDISQTPDPYQQVRNPIDVNNG